MITFDQTLYTVERIQESLRTAQTLEVQVRHACDNLRDFENMLRYARKRGFSEAGEVLAYIDRVLIPRLEGIVNALEAGTAEPVRHLNLAAEQAERLIGELQAVTGGDAPLDL